LAFYSGSRGVEAYIGTLPAVRRRIGKEIPSNIAAF
jgi:hypothetical protein